MRDRTKARNYSPERDEFRRDHERRRAFGLARRHAERLRHARSQPRPAWLVAATERYGQAPPSPPRQTPSRQAPSRQPATPSCPTGQTTPPRHRSPGDQHLQTARHDPRPAAHHPPRPTPPLEPGPAAEHAARPAALSPSRPVARSEVGSVARPASRPVARPESRPAVRAESGPVVRAAARSAAQPTSEPVGWPRPGVPPPKREVGPVVRAAAPPAARRRPRPAAHVALAGIDASHRSASAATRQQTPGTPGTPQRGEPCLLTISLPFCCATRRYSVSRPGIRGPPRTERWRSRFDGKECPTTANKEGSPRGHHAQSGDASRECGTLWFLQETTLPRRETFDRVTRCRH